MIRKQRTRWFILVLGLILTLTGWWFLNSYNGGGAPITPVATMGLDSAGVGVRGTIPKAEAKSFDKVSDVAKDPTSPPGGKKRRKPQVDRDTEESLSHSSKPEEIKKPKAPKYDWVAVDEFGQNLEEQSWILLIEKDGQVRTVTVESDSHGKFKLPESQIPADATFRALLPKSFMLTANPLGQEIHKPLREQVVVRVVRKGHLRIQMTQADGGPSELQYSALLFAPGKAMYGALPEVASELNHQAGVHMEVDPGHYELVVTPKNGLHHVVLGPDESPIRVKIQPGGTSFIQLQEPEWDQGEWQFGKDKPRDSMMLALIGSRDALRSALHAVEGTHPRWRTAIKSKTPTPFQLWPKPTLARIHSNLTNHRLAILFEHSVMLLQSPGDERDIQLGAFAGLQIQTQVRTITSMPTLFEFMQPKPADVDGKLTLPTPNWIEVKADYANDVAWSKAQATIILSPSAKDLKVSSNIKAQVLNLSGPRAGRATPPAGIGLRWFYETDLSEISHLSVDLRPSSKLLLEVPIPKQSGPNFLGTLSWTPRSKPGVLSVGQWSAHPKHLRGNKPPGFRTFQLQCVQRSGAPAPFAMVQVRSTDDNIGWRGSADGNGLLRLEVLGSGPFWIDSDLVQSPVQIQLHDKSDPGKTLTLMVPMRHNRVNLLVSGEDDFDLSQLKVRLSLWKQPKEFPGRIYPDLAEGHLNAEGQISFQSLVPALYRIELFDPRSNDSGRSRKVRIGDRNLEPQIMMHWRP